MNLSELLEQYSTLTEFFEKGQLGTFLGKIGLNAAEKNISDFKIIKSEKEKKRLIESTITHLEFAYQSYLDSAKNIINETLRKSNRNILIKKILYILCLKAVCEHYIKSFESMEISLAAAKLIHDNGLEQSLIAKIFNTVFFAAPVDANLINIIDTFRDAWTNTDFTNPYDIEKILTKRVN